MADQPVPTLSFDATIDWLKRHMFQSLPGTKNPAQEPEPTTPTGQLARYMATEATTLTTQPVTDFVQGLNRMAQGVVSHPIESITAFKRLIPPIDQSLPMGYNPKDFGENPDNTTKQTPMMEAAPLESVHAGLVGRAKDLVRDFIPDVALAAYDEAQRKAASPEKDIAGRTITNNDATYVMPAIQGAVAAAAAISPLSNIANFFTGSKTDPVTGKEKPMTGPEGIENILEGLGKTELLKSAIVHVGKLSDILVGTPKENLDPIVNRTRSQGEIEAAYRIMKGEADPQKLAKVTSQLRDVHGDGADVASGSSPIPLDDRGQARAAELPTILPKPDKIITSGVLRSIEMAKPMVDAYPNASQQIDSRWDAMHKGVLEGQATPEVNEVVDHNARTAPDQPIPGGGPLSIDPGESWNNFSGRVISAASDALDNWKQNPNEVHTVFTHSDVLKGLAAHAEKWGDGMPSASIDPDYFEQQEAGKPGSVYRYDTDNLGRPHLWDVSDSPPDAGGLYLIRHGETAWDPPSTQPSGEGNVGEATPPIPPNVQALSDLHERLPQDVRDQFTQPLPAVGWIQDRVAEWAQSGAMGNYLRQAANDPEFAANNPFHNALALWLLDPDARSHALNDLQAQYDMSPEQFRQLQSGMIDTSAKYAGQVNQQFSNAVQTFRDYAELQGRVGSFDDAIDAQSTINLIDKARKNVAKAASGWDKTRTAMLQIEDLRRSELVSPFETAINIAKSHGMITLMDGSDAIHASMLNLLKNTPRYISQWVSKGQEITEAAKAGEEGLEQPNFRRDVGDVLGYFNGIIGRIPWVPDALVGKVHFDPSVYGIDADTYNMIQKDAKNGVPIAGKVSSGQNLMDAYQDDLHSDPAIRRQQLNEIVNGVTHRNVVDTLLNASPLTAGRVLGGYQFDAASHIMGPQAALLSKALEHTFNTYQDTTGVMAGLKAAWESGTTDIGKIIKAFPQEALDGKNGMVQNMQNLGVNGFNIAKAGVDFLNTANRLQMYELRRTQFHVHLSQELNNIGMSEDQALAEMRRVAYQTDPETGAITPKPISPQLRNAYAKAELASMKNTLSFEPQGGILGGFLQMQRAIGQKFLPTTPFVLTFPRYMVNYMAYIADHSPTQMMNLFSPDFQEKLGGAQGYGMSQEAVRQIARGMTGLGMIGAGYYMSQGGTIGGYTMGSKPYKIWDGKSRDADGNPLEKNIDTLGPVQGMLTTGHILDSIINQKPVNLNLDEMSNYLSGVKATDVGIFNVGESLKDFNPEGDIAGEAGKALGRFTGNYLASWIRFIKGFENDETAMGRNLPARLQNTDIRGDNFSGPIQQVINPGSLPARVNAFSGDFDIEQHPGQALFKNEAKPVYPMEDWMNRLNMDTNKITRDTGNAVANNQLRALNGMLLSSDQTNKIVKEAVGVDKSLPDFIKEADDVFPMKGPDMGMNRQIQQKLAEQIISTLHKTVWDGYKAGEIQKLKMGEPSPVLAEEYAKEKSKGIPFVKEDLLKQLKDAGFR